MRWYAYFNSEIFPGANIIKTYFVFLEKSYQFLHLNERIHAEKVPEFTLKESMDGTEW